MTGTVFLRRATLPLGAALLLVSVCSLARAGSGFAPPSVGVRSRIEATQPRHSLGADCPTIEKAMTDQVIGYLHDAYPYVRWVASPTTDSVEAAQLDIVVSDGPLDESLGTNDVVFGVSFQPPHGAVRSLQRSLDDVNLFRADEFDACKSKAEIQRRVQLRITDWFGNGEHNCRGELESQFFSSIVIADDIVCDTLQERVIVPVPHRDLSATDGTRLLVRFGLSGENQEQCHVALDYKGFATSGDAMLRGMVTCRPRTCDCCEVVDENDLKATIRKLQGLVEPHTRACRVYVGKYVKDALGGAGDEPY